MKALFIIGVASYLLWVVLYLLYERILVHRKKRHQSKIETSIEKPSDEDIIGKSLFDLCHSLPEASTAENPEKAIGNHNIFAAPDDNMPMEIDVPLEYENDDETDNLDDDEEEESWLNTGVMLAKGSTFEEMGSAVRTVVHHDTATIEEKEQAGGVLTEIRQTDMFEQLAQSAPGREDIVGEVINLHLAAYRKLLSERNENPDGTGTGKVPADFDIKNFV